MIYFFGLPEYFLWEKGQELFLWCLSHTRHFLLRPLYGPQHLRNYLGPKMDVAGWKMQIRFAQNSNIDFSFDAFLYVKFSLIQRSLKLSLFY